MSRKVSSFFPVSRWNLISLRPFLLILAVAVVVVLGVVEDDVTAKSLFQSPQPTPVPTNTPVPPPPTPIPPAPVPDSGDITTVQSTTEQTATEIVTDTIQATEAALPPVDSFIEPNSSGGESVTNLTVDQVELIDSIVVSSAYIWLCFGVAIFLIVPILLLILQIRGSSKVKKAERF